MNRIKFIYRIKTSIYFFLFVIYILGCSSKPHNVAKITIKGSDSMLKLTENLVEDYMKINPGISIYVFGAQVRKQRK